MRPLMLATGGAALLAWTAFAASHDFWQGSPDTDRHGTAVLARAALPAAPAAFVRPECALDRAPEGLLNPDGSAPPPGTVRGGTVPAGFTPVRAVLCSTHGNTTTQLETHDPVSLSRLTQAYEAPLIITTRGGGCTLQMDMDPILALVDAHGAAILPAAPRDLCGHIVPALADAVAKGEWTATH